MNELLFAEWAQLVIPMHCWCGRRCGECALLTTQSLKRADMRRAPWIWSAHWVRITHLLISSLAAYPLLLVQSVIRCLDLLIWSRLILNVPSCPLSQCLEKDVNHLATFFGATSHNIVDLTVVSLSNWSNLVALLIKFNQWGLRATRFDFQSGQKQSTRSWLPW